MADRAQVTSVEAVEAFRANLVVYLSRARPAIEEVSNDVLRLRSWVQADQRKFWENELRKRRQKLERAQAELSSARMSLMQDATIGQQMDVRRAQYTVDEAEAKLSVLKKWDRELENRSVPMLKQVEQLHTFLTSDMPKAVAYLAQVVKALEAYTDVMPGGSGVAPPDNPPAEPPPAGEGAPE